MKLSSGIGRETTHQQGQGHVAGNLTTIDVKFAGHSEGQLGKLFRTLGIGRNPHGR
jgi:hypothetical protein